MKWDALAVFTAVAETRSFTAAAARLGMPKSSVSRQIARLEDDLGTRLFHRTTRRVTPTPAGRDLAERVGPLVAALDRIASAPDLRHEPTGTLRVTTAADLGAALLADVVTRYAVRHPQVDVEVRVGNEALDLVAEGLDAALRVTTGPLPEAPGLTARRLGGVRLQLYASPAYVSRRGAPSDLDALPDHDLVGFDAAALPLPGRPRVRCDDMNFARAVVRAGAGVGVLPSFLGEPDVADGRLVRVLPSWTSLTGTVWLVTPYGRRPPARLVAFRELLMDAIARSTALDDPAVA